MILDITNRCNMGCPHCLNNCVPEGTDMSMETLDEIIKFINHPDLHFRTVLISGGEPTEHPLLFDVLDRLYEANTPNKWGEQKLFLLLTNGMFLNKNVNPEDYQIVKEYSDRLLGYNNLVIQITADPRFHKIKLNERNLKYLLKKGRNTVSVENNIALLSDYGRAVSGDMPEMKYRTGPFCFNARSMARSGYTFPMIVEKFEVEMNKHCAIGIDMHGDIRISESLTCSPIGSIHSSLKELETIIRNMTCKQCSHIDNLSPAHRKAIGI